jgi:RNA polymerase sigma-70 factor (ECF subfamily)
MTDTGLVERARRGDRAAYERLAYETGNRLYQVAYRIVRDADLAQDAVQQTLVAVWTDLPTLRDAGRYDAWSYRMVVRFALADARRRERAGLTVTTLIEELPEPGDAMRGVEDRDEFERAFRALSSEHRAVLVLHYYVGMPLTDIADTLGVPYGTAGSRLSRATQQLRASVDAGARMPGSVPT